MKYRINTTHRCIHVHCQSAKNFIDIFSKFCIFGVFVRESQYHKRKTSICKNLNTSNWKSCGLYPVRTTQDTWYPPYVTSASTVPWFSYQYDWILSQYHRKLTTVAVFRLYSVFATPVFSFMYPRLSVCSHETISHSLLNLCQDRLSPSLDP
jgi:hypothetical protein